MANESHSDLDRQFSELSSQVLGLSQDPALSDTQRHQLENADAPCDPELHQQLKTLFQQQHQGRQEWLRMQVDALRRVSRSRETEQIFRAYGVLELITPLRIRGKVVHALFSGPLKISAWTRQEKETLARICGLETSQIPAKLDDAAIFSPAQVKLLIRKQEQLAELLAQSLSSVKVTELEPAAALPSSLGLDLLQPGFVEHLDLLFSTVSLELKKSQPFAPASVSKMQTAMQRGRHLAAQIRKLSQQTFSPVQKVSVHRILEQWQETFSKQHPSLRINMRLEAAQDDVTANPHQLQHMLFTLMASVADGLPEAQAVMGLSTRNLDSGNGARLHLEIRDGGGLATFAGVGGQQDAQVLSEQNEAAEEFADWFTLASRMDAELHVLRDEGIVTRAELLIPMEAAVATEAPTDDSHQLWVVEDDDREYESLQHMLQLGNLKCTRFTSAEDLRRNFALASSSPDLVLLKYYLPDQRGAEVRSWLYEQDPGLPVILISGLQATHPGIATANSLPSTLYLQKPFDSQDLLDMVHMNLDDTLPG